MTSANKSLEKKNLSAILYFGILLLKNWLRLRRQFKLNMESFEPADEEELSTFSLGMEFLTPQKERKEKENKEQARPVLSRFANHRVENVIKQLVHTSACVHRDMILKKLELLSAIPRATLTHLSCPPNFPSASYLGERTLTYEPIVNCLVSTSMAANQLTIREAHQIA